MSKVYQLDMKGFSSVVLDEHLIGMKNIRKLSISKHISKLPIGAFSSCKDLKKIHIESNSQLRQIPQFSFAHCKSLNKINQLPEDLVSIEANAFLNCVSIEKISIPKSVIFIAENAFDGWTENQTIYCYKDYGLSKNCRAKVVNLNEVQVDDTNEDEIYIEDGLKFFIVRAKCGHVGRQHYVPIDFPIRAKDAKEAAEIIRITGRVKHNHKDAILEVASVSKYEYINQKSDNQNDPYLNVRSKHEQLKVLDQIKDRFIKDPNYLPVKNKKRITSKKNDLSSNFKLQKINKDIIENVQGNLKRETLYNANNEDL